MKRTGCDIYGYPVYEPKKRMFQVCSLNGEMLATVYAVDVRDAMERLRMLLDETVSLGVLFCEVQ